LNKILIIGYGSIGSQYFRQLSNQKFQVYVHSKRFSDNKIFLDLNSLVYKSPFDLIIICSETKNHIQVLIEKPISNFRVPEDELTVALNEKNLAVSSPLRYLEGYLKFKNLFNQLEKSVNLEVTNTSWLPDWRSRDYKTTYSADPTQGGVLLDCIHELDLILDLTNDNFNIFAEVESGQSRLEIDVEASARVNLLSDKYRISLHLSFQELTLKRQIIAKDSKNTISWNLINGEIVHKNVNNPESNVTFNYEALERQRLVWLSRQVDSIFQSNEEIYPLSFQKGLESLKLVEKVRLSAIKKRWVYFDRLLRS
jgi:predicted dehydrogenase